MHKKFIFDNYITLNIFIIFFCICLLFVNSGYYVDNDIWFILSIGREIVSNCSLFYQDVLSMHSMDIIIHQWLFDVISWEIYSNCGGSALFLLSIAYYILTVYFFYRLCYLISDNKNVSILLSLFIFFLNISNMNIRPMIVSNMLLVFEVYVLESFFKTGNEKLLMLLPFTALLLANLHGAVVLLFFCIFMAYAAEVIIDLKKETAYNKKKFVYILVFSLVFSLVNPYGYEMLIYFSFVDISFHEFIMEMAPLTIMDSTFPSVILLTAVLSRGYIQERLPSRYLLLSAGFLVLAFMCNRGYFLFCFISCFPIAYIYRNKLSEYNLDNMILVKYALSLLSACMIFLSAYSLPMPDLYDYHFRFKNSLETVISHANENNNEIILFTEYDMGPEAEFLGLHPYIDTRAEVFLKKLNHKKDYFKEYIDFREGRLLYNDFYKEYSFNYWIVYNSTPVCAYINQDPCFELLYDDKKDNCKVFYRKDDL